MFHVGGHAMELLLDDPLRVGPRRVAVRVVGRPHLVLRPDEVVPWRTPPWERVGSSRPRECREAVRSSLREAGERLPPSARLTARALSQSLPEETFA